VKPGERMASVEASGDCCRDGQGQALAQGDGIRQPLQPHQHWHMNVFLYQPVGHVLLTIASDGVGRSCIGICGIHEEFRD